MSENTETRPNLKCVFCGKETTPHDNYCDWNCMIGNAKANGGRVHTPNNLPIRSINAKGDMYEHEHGNHPDYKCPVDILYVGPIGAGQISDFENVCGRPGTDSEVRDFFGETHALIYTDGSIALTMYEYCYSLWHLKDGSCMYTWHGAPSDWKLDLEALEKMCESMSQQKSKTQE